MLQLVNNAEGGVYHDTVEVCAEPAAPHHKHIQEIFDEVSAVRRRGPPPGRGKPINCYECALTTCSLP